MWSHRVVVVLIFPDQVIQVAFAEERVRRVWSECAQATGNGAWRSRLSSRRSGAGESTASCGSGIRGAGAGGRWQAWKKAGEEDGQRGRFSDMKIGAPEKPVSRGQRGSGAKLQVARSGYLRRVVAERGRTSGNETTGSREPVYLVSPRYIRRTWEVRRSYGASFSCYSYLSSAVFPRPGYRDSYLVLYPLAQRLESNQPRLSPRPPLGLVGYSRFLPQAYVHFSTFCPFVKGNQASTGESGAVAPDRFGQRYTRNPPHRAKHPAARRRQRGDPVGSVPDPLVRAYALYCMPVIEFDRGWWQACEKAGQEDGQPGGFRI